MASLAAHPSHDPAISRSPRQLRGTPLSPGRASGSAFLARTPEHATAIEAGAILVVPVLSPDFRGALARAAGVIAERGGPLSNGATLAREAGTPAVMLESALLLLRTGDVVTLDGARGTIEVEFKRAT